MLGFEDHYEQECALNTLWSLTTDYNKQEVKETLYAKLFWKNNYLNCIFNGVSIYIKLKSSMVVIITITMLY